MLYQPVGGADQEWAREKELYGRYGNNDSDNCRRYSSDGSAFLFLYIIL